MMAVIDELKKIARNDHGIIRTKIASENGISRAMLSKLSKSGILLRIVHGQYVFSNHMEDEMLSLTYRSKYVIFSHESALFLHGLSDRTPFEHSITVPSNVKLSSAFNEICKIYYIKPEFHALGCEMIKTQMGNLVPAYNLERTMCDIIRSRNRIGDETFFAALKSYAKCTEKNLPRLGEYVSIFRLSTLTRQYLEVLL